MKIGLVVWDLNISGGTQRQALELARNLRARCHEVVIYCVYYDKKTCYPELLSDLSVKYLIQTDSEKKDLKHSGSGDKEYSGFFGLYKKAGGLIKLLDSDLDILNIHDYLTYFVAPSYHRKYKKPVIWMMNDMPVDEPRFEAKKTKFNSISLTLKRRFLKIFIDKIDNIVVLDNWNKDKIKRTYGREVTIIRSGLDVESYKFKNRGLSEHLKIFTTGIFFPWRRFEDVIQALKFLKDKDIPFEFHHVGSDKRDMDYASKIYGLVEDLGLQKDVTFHGFVSENELIELYSSSDVFIFPNYPQTWGLSVFEAMACGTPVICSTGSGAHEVLTDKENVLLVPPMSPNRIANCLITLYSDEELWNRLHKNGRIFVEKNITWEKYTSNMEQVFEETIRGYNG